MISDKFLNNTKDMPPNRILLEALPYVKNFNFALDLGCGAFRDSRFLIDKGFLVDAVDNGVNVKEIQFKHNSLNFYSQTFWEFFYTEVKYDLINAQYSIPFCEPSKFLEVWKSITSSLKSGGIFAGQFFGPEDGFAPDAKMTFLINNEVDALFLDFKIHTFVEAKRTNQTATGRDKFWHIFDVIAERK